MKRITTILLISISTLSSALCRAESVAITHDFNDMVSKSELTFPNRPSSYAVGETDLVTYTGSDGGTFNLDGSSRFIISLPNQNSVMQTSPAIENLVKVQLTHAYSSEPPTWIKVYVSEDNSSWTDVSSSAVYRTSDIDVTLPTKGNYYIKVENTKGSKRVDFLSWVYYYEPCHCLRVVVN